MTYDPHAYDILLSPPASFPDTLRDFIRALYATQQEFAWAGGFTTAQVSRWCTGENHPATANYQQIEDLIRTRLEANGVSEEAVARMVNRLRVAYHEPPTQRITAKLEDRTVRVLHEISVLYPDAAQDAVVDGLYALDNLLRVAYRLGYEAGQRDARLPRAGNLRQSESDRHDSET